MALAASALTTLATVLDELGKSSDGGVKDARLERYITAASAFIKRFCSRTFERADAIVEKRAGFGWTKLYVERTPVVSVSEVAVDGLVLPATEYELRDAGDERSHLWREVGWAWTASRYPGITQPPAPGQENRVIQVTYNGGYVTPQQVLLGTFATRTLPEDLEDACVMLATSRWRGRGTDARVVQEGGQNASRTFGGVPIPAEVLAMLEGYARIVHA